MHSSSSGLPSEPDRIPRPNREGPKRRRFRRSLGHRRPAHCESPARSAPSRRSTPSAHPLQSLSLAPLPDPGPGTPQSPGEFGFVGLRSSSADGSYPYSWHFLVSKSRGFVGNLLEAGVWGGSWGSEPTSASTAGGGPPSASTPGPPIQLTAGFPNRSAISKPFVRNAQWTDSALGWERPVRLALVVRMGRRRFACGLRSYGGGNRLDRDGALGPERVADGLVGLREGGHGWGEGVLGSW